ncbi:NUDIX domain-containing protein [Balneicella halophila]|uniref:NUDIX domain-containing protein n=2 Tax=Balneicella halophila TaxID=1537566 RepID=A0A7L4UND4_BALHA|nr:NUDIX domain-containing protein [Balneicella halophila]
MYKVFFKDRTIFINEVPMMACVSYGIHEKEEVDRYVDKIINYELEFDICIVYPDTKALFKYFKSKFNYVRTAGGLVFNTDNRFLAIYRYERWDLPKGRLKKTEKNRIAAIREVEEETGITAPVIVDKLPTTYHIYKTKGIWELKKCTWYLMRYEGNEKLVPQTKEGITKCKWFKTTSKGVVLNSTYNSIKEVLNAVL